MPEVRPIPATRLILIENDPGADSLDPFDGLSPLTVAEVRQILAGPPQGELLRPCIREGLEPVHERPSIFEGVGEPLTERVTPPAEFVKGGRVTLHHFTRRDRGDTFTVDPQKAVAQRGSYSRRDFQASDRPRTFFYLDPADKETQIGHHLYTVTVDADRIYNLLSDPKGFKQQARRGGSIDFDALFDLVIAAGYDGVYYRPGFHVVNLFVPVKARRASAVQLAASVMEGKAIGSAMLKANVGERDRALRVMDPSMIRRSIRRAGSNAPRALQQVYQEARLALPPIVNRLAAGAITLDDAQLRSAVAIRRLYERMRQIGRRSSGLRELGADEAVFREEERWFRSAVREELRYWNTFLQEVEDGRARRIPDRINAYIDALRFMYEASRVAAMPDNTLLHWVGPRDEKLCPGCAYLMEMSPFVKDNIPAVPRDGSTSCLTHCRHRIVVRVANNLNEVVRRRQQLPRRDAMVRELKRRQGRGGRDLARPDNPRGRNPFHREGLTRRVSRPT
jgi:hypothetical protein